MKRVIISFLLGVVLSGVIPSSALAHVFIKDTTGDAGLVMHLTPDDDPIAGEPANFYFDIDDSLVAARAYSFRLSIMNDQGQVFWVPITPGAVGSASASYTFPAQGTYTIRLEGQSHQDQQKILFEYVQRVSRGKSLSPLHEPRYLWAEILLVAVLCSFLILVIIAYNKRKQIAAYTKWK